MNDSPLVETLAAELRAEFGMRIRSWPDVVRYMLASIPSAPTDLLQVAADAQRAGDMDVALWLQDYVARPASIAADIVRRDEVEAQIATLGTYVRAKPTTDRGPGPWHATDCRWVREARRPDQWEGRDTLPDDDGYLCSECRAGGELPTPEATLEAITAKGTYVRRRANRDRAGVDHPAGVWHAGSCKMLARATDARWWEGTASIPAGDKAHACVTRRG